MLIAITGQKFSGKSTVAEMLSDALGYPVTSFAKKLKEVTCVLSGCTMEQLEDFDFKETQYVPDYLHIYCGGRVPTFRAFLQHFGTDVMRKYNNNIWIDCTLGNAPKNVIVSDCRFINEANAVKDRGGIIVKVERGGMVSSDEHSSESQIPYIKGDYTIKNDGDLDDLRRLVTELVDEIKKGSI